MKSKKHGKPATRALRGTILQCAKCHSHRAVILDGQPLRARCFDCNTVYRAQVEHAGLHDDIREYGEPYLGKTKNGKTKADYRAEIEPAAPPDELPNTAVLTKIMQGGPAGLRKAQHYALRHAKQFISDACDEWRKDTKFLAALEADASDTARACARYARRWRPKFLAWLSITNSARLAAQCAGIHHDTAYQHRKKDEEFAAQWHEATEYAIELLAARAYQRALEGDVEPVYYMGVPVSYIRKFDSRLQIEVLRAYKPERYKTPGINLNLAAKGDVFVLTEDQRHRLQEIHKASLDREEAERNAVDAGASTQPQLLTNGNPVEPVTGAS